MVLFGFDPGGIDNFGWATLCVNEAGQVTSLTTGISSNAYDAVSTASANATIEPNGVGIDAPLFWAQVGDRRADAAIRKRVRKAGGNNGMVNSVNSLRGACLVQGVLTAHRVTTIWPLAVITEAHPKALLLLHPNAAHFVSQYVRPGSKEHERDAALAALAAWAAVETDPNWENLMLAQSNPFFPGGEEVSYWFPRESNGK